MNPDFTNNRRAALMLLSIVVLLGLVGGVIVYLFTGATAAPQVPSLCSDDKAEIEFARALVKQGLQNALTDHAQHLMSVWIRDNVDESGRAATGIRNGMRAYFHAQRQIDAWVIPPCKETKP